MSQDPDKESDDAAKHAPGTASPALPSVVVDPSLYEPAPAPQIEQAPRSEPAPPAPTPSVVIDTAYLDEGRAVTAARSEPTPQPQPIAEPVADTPDDAAFEAAAAAAEAISDQEADQFAAALRPSWDMVSANPATSAAPHSAMAAPHAAPTTPTPDRGAPADDIPTVVAAKLDRRIIAGAIGVLLLIIAILWSLIGGTDAAPPAWSTSDNTVGPATHDTGSVETQAHTPAVPAQRTGVAHDAPHDDRALAPAAAPTAPAARRDGPAPAKRANTTVHIRVTTRPASADLRMNGELVPNPFDAWVAQGGTHRFTASAPGYDHEELVTRVDEDQLVTLTLRRDVADDPAPAPTDSTTASADPATTSGALPDNPF